MVLAGFVALSHASFLRVEQVTVLGTETLSPQKIEEIARGQIAGAYGYLFARDNIFIYPKSGVTTRIGEYSPSIKTVEVEAKDFHTIEITVVERSPKALWCEAICFFMDEDGVVYEPASSFSAPVYVSYEGKATILEKGALPKQYLSVEDFRALSALVDALAQTQAPQKIDRVVVDKNGDVRARFESGFTLLFVLKDDGGDVYERFTLALKADPFDGRSINDFEYLDLRFGDKLYYKRKGE